MVNDNVAVTAGNSGTFNYAADGVTYSGDEAKVSVVRDVHVSGAEGSKTLTEITDTSGRFVHGPVAHDAPAAGNPLPIGGYAKASSPANVSADADAVRAWFLLNGTQVVNDIDYELGNTVGRTSLRDNLVAQRHTVLADSLADGLAAFWTSSTANGGTATSSGGEGLLQTSANATGSAQLVSTTVNYLPGMVAWLNSAVRFNDTGSAGNIRRIGAFTVSGTTPQNGFYFELSGTTLNAVVVTGGTPTAVASASWSKVATEPFSLDTNYHSFEIRFTANSAIFMVDNRVRHIHTGTTAAITATLNFPICLQSINTSGATNRLMAVRNIGMGRFGAVERNVEETGLGAVHAVAMGGGTPHDAVDSGNPVKIGGVAVSGSATPTSVAAGDRTRFIANQHGIPYSINGHPNLITREYDFGTGAQTDVNLAAAAVAADERIYVTRFEAMCDNANTVAVSVRAGFGTANVPAASATGVSGMIASHPGVAPGSGFVSGNGSGLIAVGGAGEEPRLTSSAATTGNLHVVISFFVVDETP